MLEQGRARVPGHRGAAPRDVVAVQRRDRNADDVGDVDARGEGAIFVPDALELAWLQATRSILLTMTATSRMPSSATM